MEVKHQNAGRVVVIKCEHEDSLASSEDVVERSSRKRVESKPKPCEPDQKYDRLRSIIGHYNKQIERLNQQWFYYSIQAENIKSDVKRLKSMRESVWHEIYALLETTA